MVTPGALALARSRWRPGAGPLEALAKDLTMKLTVTNHDRDAANLQYVYPVVSRRAGGVSVGINLNPNNACNFRCVYCQVPNLVAGKGPEIDLKRLEQELRGLLDEVVRGDFMQRRVPQTARRLSDVAFSGNGEPTSSPQFHEAIEQVAVCLRDYGLLHQIPIVLITNGSLADKTRVREGVSRLAQLGGQVWFKLDSATEQGTWEVNQHRVPIATRVERLVQTARACPTWVQTCWFMRDGALPSGEESAAYLRLMSALVERRVPLAGVLLYGLARPSMQPEAPRLSALPPEQLEAFAERIRSTGLNVRVTP